MEEKGRLLHLDGLRAFAILAVFLEHFSGFSDKIPIGAGTLGVHLFFVLSGFLITSNLLRSSASGETTGETLKSFYIRRSLRLFPAYYLTLACLILLGVEQVARDWVWHAAYLSNVRAAMGGDLTVFWSLAVEEQFYLIWPLFLLLTPSNNRMYLALSLPLVALGYKCICVMMGVYPSYVLLPAQLTCLGGGAILAVFCFRRGSPYQFDWLTPGAQRVMFASAVAGLVAAALLWAVYPEGLAREFLNDLLCLPAYVFLVTVAARGFQWKPAAMVFGNPVMTYIGRISYGLYLVHNWVPDLLEQNFGLGGVSKLFWTLVITFAVCALSWEFIEKPLMGWARRLTAAPKRQFAS